MKKNSAEAKAWGAKMKRSRNNKTKSPFQFILKKARGRK
jgi:hypothetical protein